MSTKIEFMDRSQKANIKIKMVKGNIEGVNRMILQFFPRRSLMETLRIGTASRYLVVRILYRCGSQVAAGQ